MPYPQGVYLSWSCLLFLPQKVNENGCDGRGYEKQDHAGRRPCPKIERLRDLIPDVVTQNIGCPARTSGCQGNDDINCSKGEDRRDQKPDQQRALDHGKSDEGEPAQRSRAAYSSRLVKPLRNAQKGCQENDPHEGNP